MQSIVIHAQLGILLTAGSKEQSSKFYCPCSYYIKAVHVSERIGYYLLPRKYEENNKRLP